MHGHLTAAGVLGSAPAHPRCDIAAGEEWFYELLDTRPRWFVLCIEVIGNSYVHLSDALHAAELLKNQ